MPPIAKGARTFSRNTLGSTQPPPPAFVSHWTQAAQVPVSSVRSALRNVWNASAPGYTRRKRRLLSVKRYQFPTAFAVVTSERGRKPSSGR